MSTKMTVTIDQIMAWHPCGYRGEDDGTNYTRARVERLMDGRDVLSPQDIAAMDIPDEDKVWALLHNEFLADEQMHLLACDFAEHVVHLCGDDDPRPRAAIDAKRAWLRGEISDEQCAAARAAAGAAAWDAAWDAALASAWDAAWDAAWEIERKWQLQRILEIIGNNCI